MASEAGTVLVSHGGEMEVATDWANDPANPRGWSLSRKTASTAVVSGIGFVATLAATIYTPGHDQVSAQFGVSTTVSLLPLSFYNLGMALGPVVSSPLSETFGRRLVYMITMPTFALFSLGAGFARSVGGLNVCRFFAGVCASPGVSLAAATIADIFAPVDRGTPIACYYTIPFVGSLIGPLIGGFVVKGKNWRWTLWTTIFFIVAFLWPIIFVRESYRKTILERREKHDSGVRPKLPTVTELVQSFKYFMTKTVIRPIHMLFTEPIVGFVCLYSSFQFALLYTFVVGSPYVFATVYGFDLTSQGLTFLGFVAGVLATIPLSVANDQLLYRRQCARFRADNPDTETSVAEFQPEHRLYGPMLGSLILPTGLFWFAWTARPSIHWICPIIAQGVTIFGSVLIYVGANLYMVDTYGPLYGASATGATSLSRYTLSAAFPLFTLQMYKALGVGWATSLLGFCTIAMAPIPWVFWRWGPRLRARSGYERES